MQIKKRYIKEEIERLSIQYNQYADLLDVGDDYSLHLEYVAGQIKGLQWVLDFN